MEKIKVLIADDNHLFVRGIESILLEETRFEVVGKAYNGKEAIDLALVYKPDVILLDMDMPVVNGLEAFKRIIKESPDVKVIMLTSSENDIHLYDALRAGAKGFLLKDLLPNELLTFIYMVYRGESIISGQMATKIIESLKCSENCSECKQSHEVEKIDILTKREKEILIQVMKGLTNREIAAVLDISENTVKNHLRNIMEKLQMNNRVQAATYALKEGWLEVLSQS